MVCCIYGRLIYNHRLCIAAFSLASNCSIELLTNLATLMRHTLATANKYYNHSLLWAQARSANIAVSCI